ncbi:MAG TPA: hypothetical protein VNV41_08000 [Candidatus Acidoferrales bacterium]|nr:hypothetical protein [Candidatus Acidoferrales bacterium]
MRLNWRGILGRAVLAGVCLAGATSAGAQDDQFLMPDQSAAKARKILDQAVEAMGGNAYLNVHDVTCIGRIGQFDHAGEVTGFGKFIDYTQPPFKERQENLPKRNIIQVYNGDKGWDLDRGGVSDAPRSDVTDFKEETQKDLDYILRRRSHEPGMVLRYGGPDVVDLKQAEWVEMVDSDNRTIRIAFADNTHLPIRKMVETRDPRMQRKTEEIEYYSNYHPIDGVQTPFQITRERNQIKIFQVFFDKCDYNTSVADALFTKESLDQRWAQIPNKEKVRDKKETDRLKDKEKDDQDSDSSDKSGKN